MSHSNVLSSVYSESPPLRCWNSAAKTAHIGSISQPGHVAPLKMICRVKMQVEDWLSFQHRGYAPDVPRQVAPEHVASRFTVERDIRKACRHSRRTSDRHAQDWFVALAALSKWATPRRVRLNATADHVVVLPGCQSACNFGSDAFLVQLRLFCAD